MKKTHQVVFVAVFISAFAAIGLLAKRSLHKDLYERYPEIDRKIVRQAYSNMMSRALRGQIDVSKWSDEQFSIYFLGEVMELTSH